jgi:GDSL-like lipase/acylhydrolase family protein
LLRRHAAMRRLAARALVLAAALGIALFAAEWAVRLLAPRFDPRGQISFAAWTAGGPLLGPPNRTLGLTKNTGDYDVSVTFGPDGFRERRALSTSRDEDVFLVGDSYAFGWGVEEADRISGRLEALTGRRVFDLGIPGADLRDYESLLDWAISRGAPVKHVLVLVCMENDLLDYEAPVPAIPGALAEALGRARETVFSSALYALLTTAVHTHPALERAAVRAHLVRPNLLGLGSHALDPHVLDSSLARCRALASRFDARFALIASRGLWAGPNRAVEDEVHRRFAARLREAGLFVIDLRPAFEEHPSPLLLHFAGDGHWNPLGHRVAARAIARAF